MEIRIGYDIRYLCPAPTPMILSLNVHYSRASDLVRPDHLITEPPIPVASYRDLFGNWCTRLLAPQGELRLSADAIVRDSGKPDPVELGAEQQPVQDLPEDALIFLLGSRYCETDLLSETAWKLFEGFPPGWPRVQAICDFVHQHVEFGYEHALSTKTARETLRTRSGVCRDFTHLALAFCRCMNIPARYCTGYLSDVGMAPPYAPMDFAAWTEVYLGGRWHTFDPRNNAPRRGRILMARGRDAADVAISNSFGVSTLTSFHVWTDEVR